MHSKHLHNITHLSHCELSVLESDGCLVWVYEVYFRMEMLTALISYADTKFILQYKVLLNPLFLCNCVLALYVRQQWGRKANICLTIDGQFNSK